MKEKLRVTRLKDQLKDVSVEYLPIRSENPELAKFFALLESEDVKVLAMELNDLRDELTDQIRRIQETFLDLRLLPGWTTMPEGDFLAWDGTKLLHVSKDKKTWTPLLSAPIDVRASSAHAIPKIYEECHRPRT